MSATDRARDLGTEHGTRAAEEGTRMDSRTDRLALQWRTEADKREHEAECHRVMAVKDEAAEHPALADRNRRTAAHLMGVADGLRQAARQLTTELVQP